MDYRCPKCDAILVKTQDKLLCEYCRSEYDIDYFNIQKVYDYIIPFEITKKEAIKIYNKNIKVKVLTPKAFKKVKNINSIYIPSLLYDLDCVGETKFEANKINSWKSSGIKYKKVDSYILTRGGEINLENVLISRTTMIDDENIIDIEPYNYEKKIKYADSCLENCKVYDADKTKEKLLQSIKNKVKSIFNQNIQKETKDYDEICNKVTSINFHKSTKTSILIPIWIFQVNYKNKVYKYIINGQTGLFCGDIPINKRRIIYLWIGLFLSIFCVLLMLSLCKVKLW